MISFDYTRPKTIEEACSVLKTYGEQSRVLAGGTDLLVQLRDGDKRWNSLKMIVDCANIEALKTIELKGNTLEIAACATYSDIEKDRNVRTYFPFLAHAAHTVGATQIRNLGTIGGGICNGSPASDLLTPLIAVEAKARVVSSKGVRELAVAELYDKSAVHSVQSDELLTHFILPILPEKTQFAFVKLGRRKALAISRMNVAVAIRLNDKGMVEDVRIAPGCVFATPMRVTAAENMLLGKEPTDELFKQAGQRVSSVMIEKTGVRWSTEYKKPVVEALTERALREAMEARS